MDDCLTAIYPEYITEYQEFHKAIALNLNRMIWNIAFLKKAKEAQETGATCRNDFAISHLYKNEFELLVLRLHRTLLDEGADVITLPQLRNNLFSKYLVSNYKAPLQEKLHNSLWDAPETIAARKRIEQTVPSFRNHYIAHTLSGETDEYSVSFIDAETVVMAACDLLKQLGFDMDSFYLGKERFYLNFKEEKEASENFLDEFFMYQQISAWCIKEITCTYSFGEPSEIVKSKVSQINSLLK